jgi:hypothetical protein
MSGGPSLVNVTDQMLRVPEVARRLGLDGAAVYLLIADGQLAAGKGDNGMVYVTTKALEDYKRRHAASTS